MTDPDFDVETLADKTIDLLSVSAGQVIWIWASAYSLDLIEALAFRIRQCWSCLFLVQNSCAKQLAGLPCPAESARNADNRQRGSCLC